MRKDFSNAKPCILKGCKCNWKLELFGFIKWIFKRAVNCKHLLKKCPNIWKCVQFSLKYYRDYRKNYVASLPKNLPIKIFS